MNLVMTVNEPIYRGDNLNQKIVYLIPLQVGEVDMLAATPYLSYIRADGVADIVRLERTEEKYKEAYYQYVFPVSCRLSKSPGEVCTWLQIFSGTPSNPTIAKSGECLLYVEDSKNMDDYICDHQLSAIYALQKQTERQKTVWQPSVWKWIKRVITLFTTLRRRSCRCHPTGSVLVMPSI